jgi:hypothetical protein
MRTAGWLTALLAASVIAGSADAQGIAIWTFQGLGDFGPPGGKRPQVVYFSSSPYLGAYATMPCCSYPVMRVSFFQPSPPLVSGPPVIGIAATRPGLVLDPDLANLLATIRHHRTEPPPVPAPLDPGAPASVFRPILPEDRLRALQPEQPDKPPLGQAKPPAAKANPPKAEAPKPAAPKPAPVPAEAQPKVENLRHIRLGREAFAAREYGRAERRFQDAVGVLPQDSLAYFLLAQTQLAQGKYQESVAAIQAGLRLNANWPSALFWPRDLYEGNVADYVEQMKTLADTQARFGEDPVLLFLLGYELWFDDRREEARPLFIRAAAKAADPTFSYRFVPPIPRLPLFIWW